MEPTYTIRPMLPNERRQVRRLMEQSFEAYLRPIFFIHDDSTLVATCDGEIVAGINLDIYTIRGGRVKMGYVGWLYTDVRHRGAGLGGRLFEAALLFLQEQGCTDVGACVEGDNPSSFKQMAYRGFSILSLGGQLKRFGLGIFTVWKHASRFLDMGYFFWHRRLGTPEQPVQNLVSDTEETTKTARETADCTLAPSPAKQTISLFATVTACSALWAVTLLRRGTLLALPPLEISLLVSFPFLLILFRTLVMWCAAKLSGAKVVYLPWDTAWFLGILLPLLVGWPFPVPGNWYIKGAQWKLKQENRRIGIMASCGVVGTMVVVASLKFLQAAWGANIVFGTPLTMILYPMIQYAGTLLAVDLWFFFYPFCGFNGSRIKRLSTWLWMALVICSVVLVLV